VLHILKQILKKYFFNKQKINIENSLKLLKDKAASGIECDFKALIEYLSDLDPIKLLTQLTLTYYFGTEDQLLNENRDFEKWRMRIEFLAGLLITKPYPENVQRIIDGSHLEKLDELLNKYFMEVKSLF